MGLDVTHDCWHGAYSAFTRWRNAVAVAGGYEVKPATEEMKKAYVMSPYVDINWDAFEEKNYYGEWDRPPGDDPLLFLIVHSDCDGVIHPQHGIHLADRLERLIPMLDEDERGGHIYSMRGCTERFAKGLREAHAADEDVEFA